MWSSYAKILLSNRKTFLTGLVLLTVVMAYFGKDAKISNDFSKVIPENHYIKKEFRQFQEEFGQDGNILLIGTEDKKLFDLDFYNHWYDLGKSIEELEYVEQVLSVAHCSVLKRDTVNDRFNVEQLVKEKPGTQQEVDSLRQAFLKLPFYEGLLYNPESGAGLMAVTINKDILMDKRGVQTTKKIIAEADQFAGTQNDGLHYSGLMYLRLLRHTEIVNDMKTTLILAVLMAALILWLLFRSFRTMLFPMFVVLIGIAVALGAIVLLGFEISILTGLIPPLVVVVSVPDCVYLINYYHIELQKHGNKHKAIETSIEKIGYVIFFANLTTAIGFSVFAFSSSVILREFGIIAGIVIATLFVVAIILVPILLSYFPIPQGRHINHLKANAFNGFLDTLVEWTAKKGKQIQWGTALLVLIALIGIVQIKARGYLFDDVPKDSKAYSNLKFFERHFEGVLPFEIVIDSKKKKGITTSANLKRLDKVSRIFEKDTAFTRPISLVEGLKFATQAFYKNSPEHYKLPNQFDRGFVYKFLSRMEEGKSKNLFASFSDSLQQKARISMQMKDVGSHRFPQILDSIQTQMTSIFDTSKYDITYTGSSLISYRGYNFLVNGLVSSVLLAFLLISLVVAFIFRSPKMILIALLPNIIPLLITAGMMGYFDIYLKPSTVLIFSIAFGISVDFTIHFLAKYRLELALQKNDIAQAIATSLHETGRSMIYTAIILFFGFIVFITSGFEGTLYMGILTSFTIIVALMTNLLLLPSILMNFYKPVQTVPEIPKILEDNEKVVEKEVGV